MSTQDFLQDLGLFEGLSREQLGRIASVCLERRYKPGDVIFAEYSRGDEMYFIHDGTLLVQISTHSHGVSPEAAATSERRTIARLMPAQYVGEQAMVDDAVRSATVVSEGDSVLLQMRRADIERVCDEDPRIGYIFMRNVAQELSFKLRNTGLVMRGELWSAESNEAPADSGFGFDQLTDPEA
ncbi:MAG TPA: cyclic nucleotide-binding domain-containing protein [Chloroflexia bacterium]|nr:cyclic nucleotide-binding domain-containing protein [Chloroflexia bacterium]